MSVREEDRRKNSNSSRGLGLAAAAIGVGVGAALYYFFSKRPEQPDTEGSTSEGWSVEQPPSLSITSSPNSEYTTISEHTTTDTSIWITDNDKSLSCCQEKLDIKVRIISTRKRKRRNLILSSSSTDNSTMDSSNEDFRDSSCSECCSNCSTPASEFTLTDSEGSDVESSQSSQSEDDSMDDDSVEGEEESLSDSDQYSSLETGYITFRTTSSHSNNMTQEAMSDSEMENEWDITNSSADVPYNNTSYNSSPFFRNIISRLTSPRLRTSAPAEDERTRIIREQAFRERRWSVEECAICFEVMLKDQPLMQLPCTHNFHVACIGPWLQEQQTCPMCRKAAE